MISGGVTGGMQNSCSRECIDSGADEACARCPTHLFGIAASLLQVRAIHHHLS
jgi:hypothetical protein